MSVCPEPGRTRKDDGTLIDVCSPEGDFSVHKNHQNTFLEKLKLTIISIQAIIKSGQQKVNSPRKSIDHHHILYVVSNHICCAIYQNQ